jgi:uncharacterized protein
MSGKKTSVEKIYMSNLFHLAFPVHNLEEARQFYGAVLCCEEGRSSDSWIDFNLYENSFKKVPKEVDNKDVPVPHFGIILPMDEWQALADRLEAKGIKFVIEPYIRFKGEVGEQATMFFLDPSGNALEFKAFADFSRVFAK